ncbi:MAG: putative lipid II flippase FtsW [Alphaproteobacteria bacterium]|nr:putative lipid II flippase FtsW [Alphaproteobacteria bacterium]
MANGMFSRTDRSVLGRWWWTVDRPMLAALLALMILGVMLVTTASPPVAQRINVNEFHFVIRHVIFLMPALLILLGLSLCSPKAIWRIATIVLGFSILGLILVLLFGPEVKGAQRWISLFGFSIQPSEFMKPSFAVLSAWFLSRGREQPGFPGQWVATGLFLIVVTLLVLQPDIGMTVVTAAIFGAQICLAGFPLWIICALAVSGIAALFGAYFLLPHFQSRMDRFLDPASGDNYQVSKALEAFREGGLFGVGPGQGEVKLSIPDAHADFIYAVAAEEMGMWFALVILGIYVFIMMRGLRRLAESDNLFAILATGGLLTMFGLQSVVHMGSSVNVLPAKGMTLPFISYGGSSLWAIALAMGMVLALTRRQPRTSVAKGGSIARGFFARSDAQQGV